MKLDTMLHDGQLEDAKRRPRTFSSRNRKWQFKTLHDLHQAANSLLRQAILNERYKRWRKVIESYEELIWLIDLDRLPEDYEPPSSYSLLLYELQFHLGVAFQQIGKHDKAVEHFTKTIEVISIAKNGCLAGCLTNSCLMTPIYARRAFAYSKLGAYKESLKDAEKAVVLDSSSPDVYCIRALVRSTFDDEMHGLKDLEIALKHNPDHVCSIILKASFTKPLVTDENEQFGFFGKFPGNTSKQAAYEKLRQKAVRLNQDAETYLTCNSFSHPCVLEFYDKFLFPLSVPHTIVCINLTPEKPNKKKLENPSHQKVAENSRPSSAVTALPVNTNIAEKFRCGTPGTGKSNRMALKRRTDYGNAVRQFVARPSSAAEYFSQLEKQRNKEKMILRAESSLIRPGERFARPQSFKTTSQSERPTTVPTADRIFQKTRFGTEHSYDKSSRVHISESPVTMITYPGQVTPQPQFVPIKEKSHIQSNKKIVIETPSDYVIPVFQPVNIRFAPRMYYRPWSGDKLPASERPTVKFTPAFY